MKINEHNAKAWDKVAGTRLEDWSKPVSKEIIEEARLGKANLLLTNKKFVPSDWYMPVKGKKVLCLASGGGQQAPVLAALGASVVVCDLSENQLKKDQFVKERDNLDLEIIKADMTDLSMFSNDSFDLIFHPISNCYIENPNLVWKECHRILKKNGVLLSGLINPVLYIFDMDKYDQGILEVTNKIPYSDFEQLKKDDLNARIKNLDVLEYGHSLDTQIGGQIAAGFIIDGFYEDLSHGGIIDNYINSSFATKAVKK